MRKAITALAALILRIFFKSIEVIGLHRVPSDGAVLFVLNHPSGLIDPLFILTLAPRPVTFLGKATLFKMPVIGWFARGIDAIPVYRPQDPGSPVEKNRETFQKTRDLLTEGKSIAIFPEGVSHSDPQLKPLKSGAARIALGAKLERLWIVPAGLYYTSKGAFRSSVLLLFGEPFSVERDASPGDPENGEGEPSREAVQRLTDRMRQALSEVLLQAEGRETLALVERAEAIYSSDVTLGERFERRRRFMSRYLELRASAPAELAELEGRLRRFDHELADRGLGPANLHGRGRFNARALLELGAIVITLPLIVAGIVAHYPAYRLVGFLSKRLSKTDEDLTATIKVLSAMLFFPVTWLLVGCAVGWLRGWPLGLLALCLSPLCGFAALVAMEQLGSVREQVRALLYAWFQPELYGKLGREQDLIRDRIRALGDRA